MLMTKVEIEPYTVLAVIYDFMMNHVDYDRWGRYVHEVAHRHGKGIKRIIDIACGTGTLCFRLEKYGYDVWGCDLSRAMVNSAMRKNRGRIGFWCSDMRALSLKIQPEMIISLYDSMNYLLREDHWLQCMNQAYEILKSEGLFVFDVSTIYNSMTVFRNYNERNHSSDWDYTRRSTFDKKHMIQTNSFTIHLSRKPSVQYHENHRQRIRSLSEIQDLIEQTPFTQVGCYDDFTFRPGTESSERVHFVLQK